MDPTNPAPSTAEQLAGLRLTKPAAIGKADHCQQGHELATFVDNPKHVWCLRCHAAWERELSDAVVAAYRMKCEALAQSFAARVSQRFEDHPECAEAQLAAAVSQLCFAAGQTARRLDAQQREIDLLDRGRATSDDELSGLRAERERLKGELERAQSQLNEARADIREQAKDACANLEGCMDERDQARADAVYIWHAVDTRGTTPLPGTEYAKRYGRVRSYARTLTASDSTTGTTHGTPTAEREPSHGSQSAQSEQTAERAPVSVSSAVANAPTRVRVRCDCASDGLGFGEVAPDCSACGGTGWLTVEAEKPSASAVAKVVYLAHPLGAGADRGANRANAARWVAWATLVHRVAVVADWITLSGELSEDHRELGLACDLALIERCDEVWLVGGRVSPGMNIEREHAYFVGKRVVDMTGMGYAAPPLEGQAERAGEVEP